MASNLNPPSHFRGKPPVPPGDQPVLLPPSSFESTAPAVDPWKALAQATGEILDLKQQNTKLQKSTMMTLPPGEELRARVDLHQHWSDPDPSATHTTPPQVAQYHDIISRQAALTSQLRDQLAENTTRYERQVAQLEGQLLLKDSHHTNQLSGLEDRLRLMSDQYELEKQNLLTARGKCEADHVTSINQWRDQFDASEQRHLQEMSELQERLQKTEQDRVAMETELANRNSDHEEMIQKQTHTINQMKTYLSQNEDITKTSEIWRKDLGNLKQKLKDKESERSKLSSEVDLVKIRLQSQNDILTIQERELSKVKDCSNEKKRQCLLTRWREKVFELLVQMKCLQLSEEDQERKWKNQIHNLENEVESSRAQHEILQCLVQDKQAQLDMETTNRKTVEQDLVHAQQVAIVLDDKAKADNAAIVQLVDYVNSFHVAMGDLETRYDRVISMLSSQGQRLTYAGGRIELLQAQFARKEALLRLQMEEAMQERPTRDNENYHLVAESPTEDQLTELSRVTEERDALAAQIMADAQLLENKVLSAKQQVVEEVDLLKGRVEELHTSLDDKIKECDQLTGQVSALTAETDELRETVDTLKIQLAQLHTTSQHDVAAACTDQQVKHTEQLADMEHKLNEARREHTKAVVSLRQNERQMTRDKTRHTELIAMLEQHNKEELVRLEKRLHAADTERNLLMATLRQEGLVGKYKSQRPAPALIEEDPHHTVPLTDGRTDGSTTQTQANHSSGTITQNSNTAPQTSHDGDLPVCHTGIQGHDVLPWLQTSGQHGGESDEPLHCVIDDLKYLARTILADSDDSDNSNDMERRDNSTEAEIT